MRLGNLNGRAVIVNGARAIDVAAASDGEFGPHAGSILQRWSEFEQWAATVRDEGAGFAPSDLGAPVPQPSQLLAVGFNYLDHVTEASATVPKHPQIFTKFASCLTGPDATVALSSDYVDWEVELVIVIGKASRHVPAEQAWQHVAGLMVGQDLSDRQLQMRKPVPQQYSLGKSRPGFGPTGPTLVTPDELPDRDDLAISCTLNGEVVQESRTSMMLFSVPSLVSKLSAILPLSPGDLIFTGTPSGIGATRDPQRFIKPGDELISVIEGIGELRTRFVATEDDLVLAKSAASAAS